MRRTQTKGHKERETPHTKTQRETKKDTTKETEEERHTTLKTQRERHTKRCTKISSNKNKERDSQ